MFLDPIAVVRRARELAGLTQSEAGQLVGMTQHDVSVVERSDELAEELAAACLRQASERLQRQRDAAASVAHLNSPAVEAAAQDGGDAAAVALEHMPLPGHQSPEGVI